METSSDQKKNHSVLTENRKKITLTGICDVEQFDADHLVVQTDFGLMDIRGENLQVTRLSVETGDLCIEGSLDSISYSDSYKSGGGFFSRFLHT